MCPERGEGEGGGVGGKDGGNFFFVETVAAELHVELVGDGLNIAADGMVGNDTHRRTGAMAEIEMNLRVLFEIGFPVGAKGEFGDFLQAIFFAERLLEQEEDREGEALVELAPVTQRIGGTLGAHLPQSLRDVEFVDMVVEVNHGCKNTKKKVIGYRLLVID